MEMISEHVSREELEIEGPMPDECVQTYTDLCVYIIEPTRAQFNDPITFTSGYRSSEVNKKVHGQPNSRHVATSRYAAVDFKMLGMKGDMRPVFDWMRNNPKLPWEQLILEHTDNGNTIIHVSINLDRVGIRSCKEGHTNNATPYTDVEYVTYEA